MRIVNNRDPIDRREFMQITGAALAASVALRPRRAAAQLEQPHPDISTSPNERITLGFIGMGVMNREHLARFLGHGQVQVLAVCDVDRTRREHAQSMVNERYGNTECAGYNDHRDLLNRDDIDAVVISTPDHWHAIQVIDACKAGKDIYCEKPLSLTLREARLMVDAVGKHQRVLQTGSQQRTEFDHRFVTACEYVRNGRIGKVLNVNVGVGASSAWCKLPQEPVEDGLDWDRWLGPAPKRPYHSALSPRGVHGHYPDWRDYREYAGGRLADMGAHHFDIAQWGLNADESGPVEVMPPDDPNANYGAVLKYRDGTLVTHGGPHGTTFIGTNGLIHVARDRLLSVPGDLLDHPLVADVERLPRKANHHADWLECIRTRGRPICDVEIGARSAAVCHLLNLAYWHHQRLKWDPVQWRFVDGCGSKAWMDYRRRKGFELPEI
jgi:predicted dehydrogenase